MTPTAFTLAFRAASAFIKPTTHAAPAMSPFMSSIPEAGLIEIPPVSKQTPLPMKASGASFFLPPFQRMTTTRLSLREPWPTPSSAFMPSFFSAGALGELVGIEHVGRLVDQVARHDDAIGDRFARLLPFLPGRRRVADRDG